MLYNLEIPKRRLPALANKGIFFKHFQVNQTKNLGPTVANQYSIIMTSYNCSYNIPMMAVDFAQVSLEILKVAIFNVVSFNLMC